MLCGLQTRAQVSVAGSFCKDIWDLQRAGAARAPKSVPSDPVFRNSCGGAVVKRVVWRSTVQAPVKLCLCTTLHSCFPYYSTLRKRTSRGWLYNCFFFLLFYHDHTITYRESAQKTADAQFSPCNIPAMHYGRRIQHNKAKISWSVSVFSSPEVRFTNKQFASFKCCRFHPDKN